MNIEIIVDVLKNSCLITGLVVVMMMMIEYINVQSSGKWFNKLRSSKPRQVLLGSILGLVPGCIGGFAAVSLYSHKLISFGALVAMMICSSGDEAFVLLAMIPHQALILFAILFVISIAIGLLTDTIFKGKVPLKTNCDKEFEIHKEDTCCHQTHPHEGECEVSDIHTSNKLPSLFKASSYRNMLKPSKEKIFLLIGLALFIAAIFSGFLEHEHEHDHTGGINLLDERWLNILFACLSIIVLLFTMAADEHFIKEHIWKHVIKKHFLSVFLWTLGALFVIQIGLQYVEIGDWIKDNSSYLIIIAALIGMIPESGPHMIFITLFAQGFVPFSVLLASSISQDGHTTLPLLASNKRSFVTAKIINAFVAVAIGGVAMLFGF